MNKYKIKFTQYVEGEEDCECVVEAKSREDALKQLWSRNFTMYVVTKQRCERNIIEDVVQELEEVE